MKIVVASENPVKIEAVRNAFNLIFENETFEFHGINVPSGVSDQPLSDAETLKGAEQRALNAKNSGVAGDFFVGIEGGLQKNDDNYQAFAWVVVLSDKKEGKAKTGTFILPRRVTELIDQGFELGEADDIVFGQTNSKQKNGAVGILTKNKITRSEYYKSAVILALIPYLNPEIFE